MNETLYSWTFNFHKVVRQQNSGAVADFILPYSAVYLRIHKWKNYSNRSIFAKVIVKIKVARYFMAHGVFSRKVTTLIKSRTPSIDAYLLEEKSPPKFLPNPIWNDGALGFSEDGHPNNKKMSSDTGPVADPKNMRTNLQLISPKIQTLHIKDIVIYCTTTTIITLTITLLLSTFCSV